MILRPPFHKRCHSVAALRALFVALASVAALPLQAQLITDNLFLQLEADAGVETDGVTFSWLDKAELGGLNTAGTGVDGFLPTLVTNATPSNKPAVRFDGNDMLNISSNSIFDTNTVTWMAVVRTNEPNDTQWIFGNSYTSLDGGLTEPDNFGTNHAFGSFLEATRYRQFARTTAGSIRSPFPGAHMATSDWFIITGVWNGDLVKTTVIDSQNEIAGTAVLSGASGVPSGHKLSRIGADPQGGGSAFDGEIAALLVYKTNLSAGDEALVQQYLFDKYLSPDQSNADFNGDGVVDGGDFLIWQRGVGVMSGAGLSGGDANGDGAVDGLDLEAWKAQFGASSGVSIQQVPEPASLASLCALAIVGALRQPWRGSDRRGVSRTRKLGRYPRGLG